MPCLGFPPQLYLIGAQKCATTYFADILALHPQIELARNKEVDFFSEHYGRGDAWYRDFFTHTNGNILLDASTSYSAETFNPEERSVDNSRCGVAARIHKHAPNARIVYMVRDPIARTYSAYWHHVRLGEEKRPFLEAIKSNSWYLDLSRYHFQIMQYLDLFPKEQVMVLDSHVTTAHPLETAKKVWAFMGLPDYEPEIVSTDRRNASYQYNGLGKLLSSTGTGRDILRATTKLARRLLPARTIEAVRKVFTEDIPPIPAGDKAIVADFLADDIDAFTRLTGIAFDKKAPKK